MVRWGPLVQGDIRQPADIERAFQQYQPTSVIHFAALAYVGESVVQPLSYYQNNVSGLINVLDAMVRHGVQTIIFSSSCAVYGVPDVLPIAEDGRQQPISPYGHSKLVCEQTLRNVAAAHGLRFAILRYFNACGADPEGDLAERHDPETHLIPLAVDAALGRAPPLHIFGSDYPTADGTCERDFIHVSDLARAHVAALHHINGNTENLTLNLGTGRGYSVLQIISSIEGVTGRPVPLIRAPKRPGDPAILIADASQAERVVSFKPMHSDLTTIIETTWRSRV